MTSRPRFRITPHSARWFAAGLVLVGVLIGSLVPGGTLPVSIDMEPHMKHFVAFSLLGFLFATALKAGWRRALVVALGLGLLGFAIEIAQLFIPDRSFLWIDVAAGFVGALGGAVLGAVLRWVVGRGSEV